MSQIVPPRRERSRSRAFTLVELLVVIGIIALLISILLPALSKAQQSAKQVACLSNMKQIGSMMYMYTSANKGKFPRSAPYGTATQTYDFVAWQPGTDPNDGALAQVMGGFTKKVWLCPTDDLNSHKAYGGAQTVYPYSYVMNSRVNIWEPGASAPFQDPNAGGATAANYDTFDVATNTSDIRNSAEKIMFYEEDDSNIDDGNGAMRTPNLLAIRHDRRNQSTATITQQLCTKSALSGSYQVPASQARGNVVFCDGHAAYVTREYAHHPKHYEPKWEINSIPQ